MSSRPDAGGADQPLFTLVTAAYDVAAYLPAFIASIDAQDLPPGELEVVVVDDGSTDATAALLAAWAARDRRVRVLTQPNAGQGAARNRGLAEARGAWVGFPDPDDVLEADYLSRVRAFLAAHDETDMVATHRLLLDDDTGEVTDTHPLRRHFTRVDRLRDLSRSPQFFHGSAPAAFFPTARLREQGRLFDERIRPNFEDGHFCSRYLLELDRPRVGFVGSARYHYRKRSDRSSTLQSGRRHPGRYTDVVEHGYLDVLETGRRRFGSPPEWLQNFLVYELTAYFRFEDSAAPAIAPPEVQDRFHDLVGCVLALLDPDVVDRYDVTPLPPATRDLLAHLRPGAAWRPAAAVVTHHDPAQQVAELTYRYTGDAPSEELLVGGEPVVPTWAKTRDVRYHGRTLLHERILWLPTRRTELVVDGRQLSVLLEEPRPPAREVQPRHLAPAARVLTPEQQQVLDRAHSRRSRRRYADAWVLIDRMHDADDSAEHLFHRLREAHPDVNAFFVIEEGTPDWHRLRRQHGRRVVAYGSPDWSDLMLNAVHVASSHADVPICNPRELRPYRPHPWRFTFLQHGVIKDDLSGWLNKKPIDLFVTSTPREHASVVDDGTTYRYTGKQARLTGLPRFDLVLEQGRRFPPDQRDLVVVSPTWRRWLVTELESGSQQRQRVAGDAESEFAHAWLDFLAAPALVEAVREHGLRVAFLPHANMHPTAQALDLPPHVDLLSYAEVPDVRELFARAAVLVTDYSSVAFNAAYVDRPVVYLQFDRDRVLGGEHVGTRGYFDYEEQGFGPVTTTPEEAVAETVHVLGAGRVPAPEYQARIDAAFPVRDGGCRERVIAEIKALSQKAPRR